MRKCRSNISASLAVLFGSVVLLCGCVSTPTCHQGCFPLSARCKVVDRSVEVGISSADGSDVLVEVPDKDKGLIWFMTYRNAHGGVRGSVDGPSRMAGEQTVLRVVPGSSSLGREFVVPTYYQAVEFDAKEDETVRISLCVNSVRISELRFVKNRADLEDIMALNAQVFEIVVDPNSNRASIVCLSYDEWIKKGCSTSDTTHGRN